VPSNLLQASWFVSPGTQVGVGETCFVAYYFVCKTMVKLLWGEIYSSISTSSLLASAFPFCREAGFGTEASLSIICRETDTMLSSMSCWPTSSMSARVS
jgi:uncharacterized membrane protein